MIRLVIDADSSHPHAALIEHLEAWREEDGCHNGDRELADRVLLALGWRCQPDHQHPAKVRWEFGTDPIVSVWEPHAPHPIRSLDAAIGQLPFGWRLQRMEQATAREPWTVEAVNETDRRRVHAQHAALPVAVTIAAVLASAGHPMALRINEPCAGASRRHFDECPRCGATIDDECRDPRTEQ